MKILLDTNVLIDYAWKRNENHHNAVKIVTSCSAGICEGFVTSHSLCDFFFILRKEYSVQERRELLMMFVSSFTILVESKEEFLYVLQKEYFFDIEDGLQMQCAESACLDYIVTENTKDFSNSIIPAIPITDCAEKI